MVLGELPGPGRPTSLDKSRARPTALAVGAGGGRLDIFTLVYPFSALTPSLWETTRYRLKYCLKGSLSPKTTNQPKSKVQNGPAPRDPRLERQKYIEKFSKKLLQNLFAQMLELGM